MKYGLDEEVKTETAGNEDSAKVTEITKRRRPFAYWTVGGREYKLKLTTAVICQLEDKFKSNLLNVIMAGSIPSLAVMLTIIQGAMKPWEHGIRYVDVQGLFDQYTEEGGTQLSLMIDVLIPVYEVSGFFSERQAEAMSEKMEGARELI